MAAHCPECRFPLLALDETGPAAGTPAAWHYDEADAGAAADRIIRAVGELVGILRRTDTGALRTRPAPDVWSPLEYAAHVRDVLLVQRERVLMVRRGGGDEATPMGRDERAEHDGYNDQDPAHVAVQLTEAARLFANVLDRLGPDDWERTIVYRFPAPVPRTLRWVAVHTAHEAVHHLHDVRQSS